MISKTYPINQQSTYLTEQQYRDLYQLSIEKPHEFWAEQAKQFVSWFNPWQKVTSGDFTSPDIQWFLGGSLNVSYNCLDRHLPERAQQTAIIWEGDNPHDHLKITYAELHESVCKFANVLKSKGITKGEHVCIYMPMIPEAVIAMLACTRIGAVHSVVFGGFSAEALKTRILDAECKMVITADESVRGGKTIALKTNVDNAVLDCPCVKHVMVVKRTGNPIAWQNGRDCWLDEEIKSVSAVCPPEVMDANDPLFILYTSGSTGKPKGILHTHGGYLVYVAMTYYYIFNHQPGDVFWCTADIGWITGHSYLVYGPLVNGATTLMFEGVPHYPDFSRYWQIIDKHQVNIFYTAPTALRALRREGNQWLNTTSRTSLKLLASVGEPINPEVWKWYYTEVGQERCPVIDTWWQTESGGILISPLPGATPLKPGSASTPFFGIVAKIVDDHGQEIKTFNQKGNLVITTPWPGFMATIYGDHQRYIDNYLAPYPGNYLSGDTAYQDEDGYFWIMGREDDVIKVSGHRIGTGEVEHALLSHSAVAEAAVVGIPHEIKGQVIYAYITPNKDVVVSEELKHELINTVRKEIGGLATLETIQWANALPKTRSGKIMRRILRKIACGQVEELGDTSTLADPSVVDTLIKNRDLKGGPNPTELT